MVNFSFHRREYEGTGRCCEFHVSGFPVTIFLLLLTKALLQTEEKVFLFLRDIAFYFWLRLKAIVA